MREKCCSTTDQRHIEWICQNLFAEMAKLLRVCELSCAKDKDLNVFSDVHFDVDEGDIVVLYGKSGVG